MKNIISTNNGEITKQIAEKLAINYVDASIFPKDDFINHVKSYLPNIIHLKDETKIIKSRNVFILGAGASLNAYPKIFKNGDMAAECIEKNLKFNELIKNKDFVLKKEEIESKLLQGKTEKHTSFETRLTVLSHFFPVESIREEIVQLFNYRTLPSKFYEILAHLFKNRFVDAVINFNFDETFDHALDEEISTGQLKKIISDGDCVAYQELIDQNILKLPLYIKPHGTYSEKSSLRFTKEQYIDIPSDINRLMKEFFLGYSGDKKIKNEMLFENLNLIVCGFEMESVEFNSLIRKVANKYKEENERAEKRYGNNYNKSIWERKINIYFLQYDNDDTYVDKLNPKDRLEKEFEGLNIEIKVIKKFDEYPTTSYFLDEFIEDLKLKLFSCFDSQVYMPKKTDRHDILLDVLKDMIEQERRREKPEFFDTPEYIISRLIFEILIVICKNRGVIQLEESLKNTNRIGMYYQYLLTEIDSLNNRVLGDIITLFGLEKREISFGRGMYVINLENAENIYDVCKQRFQDKNVPSNRKLLRVKSGATINLNKIVKSIFDNIDRNPKSLSYFNNLWKSTNANIYPTFLNIHDHTFKNLQKENIICSDLSFFHYKKTGLKNCDTVLLISDKGALMKDFEKDMKVNNITVFTVLSENHITSKEPDTEKTFNTQMPFYDHSRHMVLFISSKKNNFKINSGIYFYKKGFSNNINAIYLDNSDGEKNDDNLKNLFKTFLTYWMKSEYYQAYGSLPYIKNVSDIKRIYGIPLANDENSNLCEIKYKKVKANEFQIKVNEKIKNMVLETYRE
jgi:SIR2-like domain